MKQINDCQTKNISQMKKTTDKQSIEVTRALYVWDGFNWVILNECMLQPKGTKCYFVQVNHRVTSANDGK